MCGITGILSHSADNHNNHHLQIMADSLHHRGPDDTGIWTDQEAGISLCHKRLSIVDLSSAGHQPMHSSDGKYVITYNGEIYNHLKIREELQQEKKTPNWKGHSDTETLLAAIQAWGIKKTLKKLVGMFAFALWDRQERTLTICRDRVGEKPLYYGWQNDCFYFASELKALKKHPSFNRTINRDALSLFLRHSYVPSPFSIYNNIKKLEAGNFLTVSLEKKHSAPEAYWSLEHVISNQIIFNGTENEAIDSLDNLLKDAVKQQMASDVPLGAFLSGGIDSSLITALMQEQSATPVKTFTIGFKEDSYNEAVYAREVASHLGTDHSETIVTASQAIDTIPKLPYIYDEPFADASQLPTYLVSAITGEKVTVALSGDAGDELFGGYNRYFWTQRLWNKVSPLPILFRELLSKGLKSLSPMSWDRLYTMLSWLLPAKSRFALPGDKIQKLAGILPSESPAQIYMDLISHWKHPDNIVLNAQEPSTRQSSFKAPVSHELEHQLMYLDTLGYLPDDILTKVDRAAMAVSLETRVPFLDHRIVEFAWSLPLKMKIRNNQGKWILRQILDRYIPRHLIERPKMGFGIPLDSWLRGPLKDWAYDLINPSRLKQEGYLHPEPVLSKWRQHQSRKYNWQYSLWNILMFQSWLEKEETYA